MDGVPEYIKSFEDTPVSEWKNKTDETLREVVDILDFLESFGIEFPNGVKVHQIVGDDFDRVLQFAVDLYKDDTFWDSLPSDRLEMSIGAFQQAISENIGIVAMNTDGEDAEAGLREVEDMWGVSFSNPSTNTENWIALRDDIMPAKSKAQLRNELQSALQACV